VETIRGREMICTGTSWTFGEVRMETVYMP
jgi:hypothetical protein